MNEEQIKETYSKLDSKSIKDFLSVVELALSESKNHKYYDLVNKVSEDVMSKQSLSFKQYRCMVFFTENYLERCRQIVAGNVKTF
jgi:hypothetical protein